MLRRRLIWQLYPSFLLVTMLVLISVTAYCSYAFRRFYKDQTRSELKSLAHFAAEQISPLFGVAESNDLDRLCESLGRAVDGQTRVTVILPTGRVIADSDEKPALMENHSDRPEIIAALKQDFGWSIRFSYTLGKNMMYVAVPIKRERENVAVIRTSLAVTAIDNALTDMYVKILYGGLAIALCSAGLSFLISRRISEPIVRMEQIAQSFSQGQLDLRVPVTGPKELAALGGALNEMARQLQARIVTITNQRNELEAVLSSMIEGVLAVDGQGHIMSINKAAADLLCIDPSDVKDRSVEEVIRNPDIQQFVQDTLKGEQPTEAEVSLPIEGGRFFQVHGASLPGAHGGGSGAVIVLNDMTRMRRLENVRRDFVANVSHELKTPVTSIQGFVEALLDGATYDPKQTKHYLGIIAKHSSRLNAIIEDLLSLSRLEEDLEQRRLSFEQCLLKPVLTEAIDLLATKAEQKKVAIELVCDDEIAVLMNAPLVEQAVFNLIDNAIKYSEPNKKIRITVGHTDNEISISVSDEGCGIAAQNLPRVFERFFVVDKGRSRKLGGTGLGLAIVKHIAQVHDGSVTVESKLGKGSTFTFRLPTA